MSGIPNFGADAQVVRDFVAEDDILQATGSDEKAVQKERDDREARHKAWALKRKSGEQQLWRPRKRHRKDSWAWLVNLENQVLQGTGYSLKHFQLPPQPEDRPHWALWPLLTVSSDQGSVELAGHHFCQFALRMNWDCCPDVGHGCWNDIKKAIRSSSQWNFVTLMMLTWNVPHGPWSEDVRFHEVVGSFDNFFRANPTPESSWLFGHLLPRFLFDLQEPELLGDPAAPQIIFDRLRNENPFQNKGSKVCMNRFMSVIKVGEHEAPFWTMRLFGYLVTAIEQDYLTGKKFVKLLGADNEMVDRTTASGKRQAGEGALARSCQNQLVVALMMLSDLGNQHRMRAILAVCLPAKAWFEHQATALRSAEGSFEWMARQLAGSFFQHLASTMRSVMQEDTLRWVGFMCPGGAAQLGNDTAALIDAQDALANTMGDLALQVVASRIQRSLWMLAGYSCRRIRFLDSQPEVARREIRAFKVAHQLFEEASAAAGEVGACRAFVERSQFQLTCVQQIVCAVKSCPGDELSDEVKRFLTQRLHRVMSTQVVEDAFQRQKRRKQVHMNRKLHFAENFKVLLDRELMTTVHHYEKPPTADAAPQRANFLSEDVFVAPLSPDFKELGGITSHKGKCDWHTASAERFAVKFADIAVLLAAKHRGGFHLLGRVWLGCMVSASHHILVRQKQQGGQVSQPFFALMHLPGSAALGWPAVEERIAGYGGVSWAPALDCSSVSFLPILDDTEWEALSYTWHSPAWQHLNMPRVGGSMPHAVRAISVANEEWAPLMTVAAKAGFWSLGKEVLKQIAEHTGASYDHGWDIFEIAFSLVKHVLQCSDSETCDHLKVRAGYLDFVDDDCCEALMELNNDGAGILDPEDEQDLQNQKANAIGRKAMHDDFVKSLRERKSVIVQGSHAASSSSGRQAKKKPLFKKSAYPPFPAEMVSQSELRKFVPPGASVWCGYSNGSWQCHLPPWRRKSFSWAASDAHEAARKCLRHLWELFLSDNGMPTSACPVAGLFTEPASSSSAPAAYGGSRRRGVPAGN